YRIGGQFVLAINVDQRLCEKNFNPEDIKGFFNKYEPKDVVKSMNSDKYIYIGEQMIGATREPDGRGHEYHSEYLLLNPEDPDQSPMRKLLNKNKEGCVVFYSYLSPCLSTCLNPERKERNIRCALDISPSRRLPSPSANGAGGRLMEDTTARWMSGVVAVGLPAGRFVYFLVSA
ncbi:hypothetical protein NFI96_002586, partial [Prochilodus magdalenae]